MWFWKRKTPLEKFVDKWGLRLTMEALFSITTDQLHESNEPTVVAVMVEETVRACVNSTEYCNAARVEQIVQGVVNCPENKKINRAIEIKKRL